MFEIVSVAFESKRITFDFKCSFGNLVEIKFHTSSMNPKGILENLNLVEGSRRSFWEIVGTFFTTRFPAENGTMEQCFSDLLSCAENDAKVSAP